MKYSIVIPTFNKLELTEKCLSSIFSNTKGEYEVIVIDNSSKDKTQNFLEKEKRITAVLNKENLGFSKANNIGAKKAKGDLLIFLNNDTEVQKGWLEAISRIFEEETKVGAVGVKLLFPDGTIQHAGLAFSEDNIPRHLYYRDKADLPRVNKQREFKAVTAACIAIPKKVFKEVGGFDERYINGLEDVDLCLRIKEAGYRIVYQPKSVVIHHESVSPGRFDYNKHNSDLYMLRWKNVLPDEHRYYREDGLNWFQILVKDMISMGYSKDEYQTLPNWIKYGRYIYRPVQKITLIFKLIITLDFKTLYQKTKKVLTHG
jgi:GT2 family glycosyltransferase